MAEANPGTASQNTQRLLSNDLDIVKNSGVENHGELPETRELHDGGITETRKRQRSTDDEQLETKRLRADNETRRRGSLPGIAEPSPSQPGGQRREWCRVYTGTRALDLLESSGSTSSNQTGGSGGAAFIGHWMAAFVYDDEVLLCDGNNVNRTLEGTCKRLKIEEFKKLRFENKIDHGERKIPKQRVEQEVDNMRNCGSYSIRQNNCQDWLKELLKKLRVRDTAPYMEGREAVDRAITVAKSAHTVYSLFESLPLGTPVRPNNLRPTSLLPPHSKAQELRTWGGITNAIMVGVLSLF